LRGFINRHKIQISKFLIVGIFSTILNFLVFKLIYIFTLNINLSSILGYIVGLLNSFLFSSKWVFSNNRYISLDKVFIIFMLIYALGGIAMAITVNVLYMLNVNHVIAWFFGACLAAINNFLFSKYLVFKD